MPWINEFSKSLSVFFKGQVIGAQQPLDFYHFFPLWYDLWVARTVEVMRKLDLDNKHYQEIKEILPLPSNFRTIIKKLIVGYRGNPTHADDYEAIAKFFERMLQECCRKDPFAFKSNLIYSQEEFEKIVSGIEWQNADPQSARKIGQLITAAGSLVHGLYNDVVTDFGWDGYGPYNVRFEGQEHASLIRHFAHLQPTELWPQEFLPSIKDLKIFALYQDIEWEIHFFGCHTHSKGKSPTEAMEYFAVRADERLLNKKEIDALIGELAVKATNIYQEIGQMNFEELKLLVMRQECYQLKAMYDKAGIDWQPTSEMIARMKGKPLLTGIFPQDKFIETEAEFRQIFGIDKFVEEVLHEKI